MGRKEMKGQACKSRGREACGEYGGRTEGEIRRGSRRKAESSDEVSGDRDGVESLKRKAARRAEMPVRCIAERGRKEPKSERRNARSEKESAGREAQRLVSEKLKEPLREARREEKPGSRTK